jgi:hypothetical protein
VQDATTLQLAWTLPTGAAGTVIDDASGHTLTTTSLGETSYTVQGLTPGRYVCFIAYPQRRAAVAVGGFFHQPSALKRVRTQQPCSHARGCDARREPFTNQGYFSTYPSYLLGDGTLTLARIRDSSLLHLSLSTIQA